MQCQINWKFYHSIRQCWKRFDHPYQAKELPKARAALSLAVANSILYTDFCASTHILSNSDKLSCVKSYNGTKQLYITDSKGLDVSHAGSFMRVSETWSESLLGLPWTTDCPNQWGQVSHAN